MVVLGLRYQVGLRDGSNPNYLQTERAATRAPKTLDYDEHDDLYLLSWVSKPKRITIPRNYYST